MMVRFDRSAKIYLFMPKKIREIKKMLSQAGFYMREGKGSHSNWKHPQLETIVTIARRDGEDAPRYLEKLVQESLKQLESLTDESDEIQHED
jgi:predicted RNA binding protein YcfA (HicA-like mRNA interferase family)